MASKEVLTKILADFLSVFYLLTLVLKTRNKSYTNTLYAKKKAKFQVFITCYFFKTERNI